MCKKIVAIRMSLTLCLIISPAFGEDFETTQKALKMISEYAESICGLVGKASTTEVQANGNAKVSELVKRLADLNVGAAVKYTEENYQGALRKDVGAAVNHSLDCKERLSDRLIDRLLPKNDPSSKLQQCAAKNDACEARLATIFDQCIKDEMDGCVDDCIQNYGHTKRECVLHYCDYDSLSSKGKAFYNRRCQTKGTYLNARNSCARNYSKCLE